MGHPVNCLSPYKLNDLDDEKHEDDESASAAHPLLARPKAAQARPGEYLGKLISCHGKTGLELLPQWLPTLFKLLS